MSPDVSFFITLALIFISISMIRSYRKSYDEWIRGIIFFVYTKSFIIFIVFLIVLYLFVKGFTIGF